VKVPVVEAVQDRVEVPDVVVVVNEILVEDRVHVRPVEGETVSDNVTVPVNELTAATVRVEVEGEPTTAFTAVGLAITVKSGATATVKATVAECESEPLVPVTVAANEPVVDPVQERVELAEVAVELRVTLVGLRVHVRPVDGATVSESVTVPVKPFVAATVIVEVPGVPTITLTVVGLAVTVKSGAAVTV
jgi:hypothetical protein